MKRKLLLYVFILQGFTLLAQNSYTIKGEIKSVSSGKIYLFSSGFDKKYYAKNNTIDSVEINKGKFMIQRKIFDTDPHPYRFMILSDSLSGVTGLVFIEPKNQIILIDSINEHTSPIIQESSIQQEIKYDYDEFFKNLVLKGNALNNFLGELDEKYKNQIPEDEVQRLSLMRNEIEKTGDSLFFEYAKLHLDSYVTLWKLIERFNNIGYKKEYRTIFNLLSNKVKNTDAAKLFVLDLNNAKTFELNTPFPKLRLRDSSEKIISLNVLNTSSDYILIDFWFSHCGPCLLEFPSYKQLYKEYRNKGFEIVGISVDSKEDIKDWKNAIKNKKLDWIQYLDEDGILCKRMNINSFPTNFLVNRKGVIIAKNISLKELQNLLLDKISKSNYYDTNPLLEREPL